MNPDFTTTYTCPVCGTVFERYTSQTLKSGVALCGKECAAIWKRGKKTKPHKLTVSDEQIIAEYQAGASCTELARKYGMSDAGIAYRLEINGIKRRKFSAFQNPAFFDTIREKQKETTLRGKAHPSFKDIPIEQIKQGYEAGMKTEELAKRYDVSTNTIIRKLRQAGTMMRLRTLSRVGMDGHVLDSRLEMLVDNWLYSHNIPHIIHPKLPWSHYQIGDFLVSDSIYIEVWGVQHRQKYEDTKNAKIAKYQEYGLRLISLYPKDFESGGFMDILEAEFLVR